VRILKADDPGLVDRLTPVLSRGGVAVLPCDTIYGLVGIAPDAEEPIRRIKGRGEDKPLLRLIASAAWLPEHSAAPLPRELEGYWPGPLTLIFPRRGGGTVALRVPRDPLLIELLERLGRPLLSTSVNRAGRPPLRRIREIVAGFGREVDLIVDAGDLEDRLPSTILDLTVRPYRLVRQGAARLPDELFTVE
jgi:L-threonylcarbamoyladenylate synthase